jgi:hypothetical protein
MKERTMVIPRSICAAVLVCGFCAAAVAAPATVTVYDSTQLALDSYIVVERIGVGSWRSAFGIPGHASEDAARSAVLDRAARAGADGIINLKCMSQTDGLFKSAGYYCYANAIRLKTASAAR